MNNHELIQLRDDVRDLRVSMEKNFGEVKEDLQSLKSSARVLDALLENYLLERVQRIEKVLHLAPYAPDLNDRE